MSDTKERILHTALEHFAREGYAASSMRDIAAQLGITKGALYRHYPSKRAILEAMVERMEQRDRENARAHELPEEALADLSAQMKEAVRREFVASNGSGKHIPALQRAFQRLSDGFLRLCGVSRGEKSYSDVLLLIPRS